MSTIDEARNAPKPPMVEKDPRETHVFHVTVTKGHSKPEVRKATIKTVHGKDHALKTAIGHYEEQGYKVHDHKPVKEGYSNYHNNRTGFAKRRREDDEYHTPDPVGRTHKIVHTVSKEGGEKHSRTVTISNSTKTHDEAKKLARAHLEKQGYTIHEETKPTSQVEKARKLGQFHKKTGFTGRNPFKDHPSDVQQAYANAKKQTNEEVEHVSEASTPKGHTIEAHGIKGMKGTPWRKTFKSHDHLNDWADKNDSVEVHGTRELEGAKKTVKEDVQLDETSIKKYKHLGATKQTTHFVKNTTTGEVLSPHRGRADAEEGLRAAEADGEHGHKFKIVRAVKEGTLAEGAYEDAEENKKSADSAKKQGDMFAHHLHMADHHDNMSQWHASKGRHGEADRHAEKAEHHHEEAMKHKDTVKEGLKPQHNMRPGWMLKADPELAAKIKKNKDIAKARKAAYGNPDAGKSVKEESELEENAPVAPTLDKKYIKGTPEWKAHKAAQKPRVGHPTKQVKEESELEEARMSAAVKLQRAFEREQEKSAASRQRAQEFLNKNKKEEPKKTNEEVELEEGIQIHPDRYIRSHGKKPSGGHGLWMFTHKHSGGVDYNDKSQVHSSQGNYSDAKKSAAKWAAEHGHKKVYVMEEVAANNVGGGAIAGTQGDAGKKALLNKKPLKRFKDALNVDAKLPA